MPALQVFTFVESDTERLVDVNAGAVKEMILGNKITEQAKFEIIHCLKNRYKSKVSLCKIEEGGLGLIKTQVNY